MSLVCVHFERVYSPKKTLTTCKHKSLFENALFCSMACKLINFKADSKTLAIQVVTIQGAKSMLNRRHFIFYHFTNPHRGHKSLLRKKEPQKQ